MFSPVHPQFRKHVPQISGQQAEYIPAQCIRLGKHAAAVVLEMPLSLSSHLLPSFQEQPVLHCAASSVFLKHPTVRYDVFSKSYLRISNALENLDPLPPGDHPLTVAVYTLFEGMSLFRTAELQLNGMNSAVSLCYLTIYGLLSLHWIYDRGVLQFVFHDVQTTLPTLLRRSVIDFLGWLRNQRGIDALMPSPYYERDWIYDAVRRTSSDKDTTRWSSFMPHVKKFDHLHVKLRPYQQHAVAWMLSRELKEPLHLLGDETNWPDAGRLANKSALSRPNVLITPSFAFHSPSAQFWLGAQNDFRLSIKLGRGGLLCDEMGLGKTVELMQLVLCNQHPQLSQSKQNFSIPKVKSSVCASCRKGDGPFFKLKCAECESPVHTYCKGVSPPTMQKSWLCQSCVSHLAVLSHKSTPVTKLPQSKATLVVVPSALLLQWKGEIEKHVKNSLVVVVFEGLRLSGYISQKILMNADVVITTYGALRADIGSVESLRQPRSNLRHSRQYFPTPVPLLMIRWHRLALDESQMLGASIKSTLVRMIGFIHANYRWCVTGTPVSKDLRRSIAMLSVVRTADGKEIHWKDLCCESPYVEVRKWVSATLRNIMWRSVKIDVETELCLPPQIVEVVRTRFGAIESYHYRSLQREIATMRASIMNEGSDKEVMSGHILNMMRQACCHPLIGASGRSLTSSISGRRLKRIYRRFPKQGAEDGEKKEKRKPLDMAGVLETMIIKTRHQCEEALRRFVSSMNGIAGIGMLEYSLQKTYASSIQGLISAVTTYRETLSLAKEMEGVAKMDDIQLMHILFNFSDAFRMIAVEKAKFRGTQNLDRTQFAALQSLGKTLRESQLEKEWKELRRKYLRTAEQRLEVATIRHREIREKLGPKPLIDCEMDTEKSSSEDEVMAGVNDRDDVADGGNGHYGDSDTLIDLTGGTGIDKSAGCVNGDITNAEKFPHRRKNSAPIRKKLILDSNEVNGKDATEKPDGLAESNSLHMESKSKHTKKRRRTQWWEMALAGMMKKQEQEEFFEKVQQAFQDFTRGGDPGRRSLGHRLHSFLHIVTVIESELKELQEARDRLNRKLPELPGGRDPTEEEVAESGLCETCRDNGSGLPCTHCKAEYLIKRIEHRLFYMVESIAGSGMEPFPCNERPDGKQASDSQKAKVLFHNWQAPTRVEQGYGLQLTSELEMLLKLLGSTLRKQMRAALKGPLAEQVPIRKAVEQCKQWNERLEGLKEELNAAKMVFDAQRSLLGDMDEVKMAQLRLMFTNNDDNANRLTEAELLYRIPRKRLAAQKQCLTADRTVAASDLKDKRGRVAYLQSLKGNLEDEKTGSKRDRDGGDDRCPICFSELSENGRVGILACAHMFCRDCTKCVIDKSRRHVRMGEATSILCPTCRRKCLVADISFTVISSEAAKKKARISDEHSNGKAEDSGSRDGAGNEGMHASGATSSENNGDAGVVGNEGHTEIRPVGNARNTRVMEREETEKREEVESTFYDESTPVVGRVGSKAAAIVRLLLGIWKQNESAKIVIFSEWNEVLEMVRSALRVNSINASDGSSFKSVKQIGELIHKFRMQDGAAVLLLMLSKGGAGLNLVEAEHVVLVEPCLDVSVERQAVGRVHRIGQTKVTYVHRIVVGGTIEDRILRLGDRCRGRRCGNGLGVMDESIGYDDVMEGFEGLVERDLGYELEINGHGKSVVVDEDEDKEDGNGDEEEDNNVDAVASATPDVVIDVDAEADDMGNQEAEPSAP